LIQALIWVASRDDVFDEPGQLESFAASMAHRLSSEIAANRSNKDFVAAALKDARRAESLWLAIQAAKMRR
jgi:hypothetical protein